MRSPLSLLIGLIVVVAAIVIGILLFQQADDGPLENAAESIEDGIEDAADDVEDAIDP